jgi:hypothetical protein
VHGTTTDSGNDVAVIALFVYEAIVIRVNIKILVATSTHSVCSSFWIFGSVIIFYLTVILLSNLNYAANDLYGIAGLIFNLVPQWLLLAFFGIGFAALEQIQNYFQAHMTHYKRWMQLEEKKEELRR